jgi:type IV pilus assembly protein PilC
MNHHLQDVLIDIQRNVSEGEALSEAMGHHSEVFDNLCISIAASGEKTGDMPAAFRYLVAHLKWTDEMNSRVRKAMRYPLVVITVVVIAVIIMMAFVVPQITQFFKFIGEGKDLPLATVALAATSEIFRAWWWAMIAGMAAAAVLILAGRRLSESFAYKTDDILLNMPVFGPLVRKINIARFVRTVSALYRAGIPFLDVVKTASDTLSNRILAEAANEVGEDMKAGKSFSQALTATGEFPFMVPLMISTGEETGKMSEVLEQIAAFYNADVDEEVQKMITMIEPALTAILGGIILWIAVGVFGPIYELFENLDI